MIGQLLLEMRRHRRAPRLRRQQIHRQIGEALLVGRILLNTAAKGELHGDQRQLVIFNQPRLDAVAAGNFLNGESAGRKTA